MLTGDIDFESLQNHGFSNGLVTEDVLLCKSVAGPKNVTECMQHNRSRQLSQDQDGSASSLMGASPIVQAEILPSGGGDVAQIDTQTHDQIHTLSEKELDRRQKLRERKRAQRQNQEFADRERLRARGRIKALREDPVFRQTERQRDRERRRKSRLSNQTQRMQERDRDKLRKSMMRSLEHEQKPQRFQSNYDRETAGSMNKNS